MVLPTAVQVELADIGAPGMVKAWIAAPPGWLEIFESPAAASFLGIHPGEMAAIALATSMRADLLLMDDRRGVIAARQQGLRVTGTLGILDLAAERGLLDFQQAIHALERATFRRPETVLKALIAEHRKQL